jgi:hypothetical protein
MKRYALTFIGFSALSVSYLIVGCVLVFSKGNDEDGVMFLNFALLFGTLSGGMAFGKFLDILGKGDEK